ncbi:MAG: S8 family serine peptidase [Bacteroidales bacterium]|jgi:subtilisin family serine protease
MIRKLFLILLLFFIGVALVSAQNNKYWVFLKNKKNITFDPYKYFDKKTIERRLQYGIPLIDSTDFPLNDDYVHAISELVDSVSNPSRWFNAISVYASVSEIEEVKKLPEVRSVEKMEAVAIPAEYDNTYLNPKDSTLLASLPKQTARMGGNLFQEKGIDGKGIRIAIFDGGFPTVDTNPAFEQVRKDGRIIKTWDFVKNKEFVYSWMSHGTMVMSCICGIINGKKIGLATGAEFLLARTEVRREPYFEEDNWLAAVEWADKNGADIISSSLGYTYQRYFPNQMDGKTALVTRAANLAAKKGILVINAVGNDGDNKWKIIAAPADADSALSVGGINPLTEYHFSFSSFGPTWDKRMKPNVSAYAHVIAAGKDKLQAVEGTSFACPLIAGFAACAWQINRGLNNMQIFNSIEESGDLFPYFDYAHGYGVPQASYFTEHKMTVPDKTFEFVDDDDYVKVVVTQEYMDNKEKGSAKYLYYNIQNTDGTLKEYNVILVLQNDVLTLTKSNFKKGQKLNVHLGNFNRSYQF